MKSRIAVALTALALTAPAAAQARPALDPAGKPVSEQEQQVLASRGQGAPEVAQQAPQVVSVDSGFDWASAALGAGGGLAIVALGALGIGATGHGRMRTAR
jgi:hypothetical protein